METMLLDTINQSSLLSAQDLDSLEVLSGELQETFVKTQIHRTRTEMEVSVLNSTKFPTSSLKYWQAMREQNVMFTELVMLSYEYKKNLKEIEILQADIMELKSKRNNGLKDYEVIRLNAQIGIKEIEIAQKTFMSANHQRTAQGRMAEIINWHEIKDQLEPALEFSKDDVDAHQLGSYLRRFLNQYLAMKREHFQNMSLPEVTNLTGLLFTALKKAEEKGSLKDVLSAYSAEEIKTLSSVHRTSKKNRGTK